MDQCKFYIYYHIYSYCNPILILPMGKQKSAEVKHILQITYPKIVAENQTHICFK